MSTFLALFQVCLLVLIYLRLGDIIGILRRS